MPTYLRRWAVQGRRPDGGNATTIFDLQRDSRHIVVYPATLDAYAVTIDRAGIVLLATTARRHDACAVPAEHARHGNRLLGLRPYDSAHEPTWLTRPADAPADAGPMELYLHLPGAEVRIIYRHDRVHVLASTLTAIADACSPQTDAPRNVRR